MLKVHKSASLSEESSNLADRTHGLKWKVKLLLKETRDPLLTFYDYFRKSMYTISICIYYICIRM